MNNRFRIALLATTIGAFSLPAFAQTATDVPGSETTIEENEALTRDAVAEDTTTVVGDNPNADSTTDTIVPGSEAQIELNEAEERNAVAEGTTAETTGPAGSATDVVVPGSGATFTPGTEPEGQESVLQDETTSGAAQ